MCYENFHRFSVSCKPVMHRQSQINKENKVIRNKHIVKIRKTTIYGFHRVIVEEPSIRGCCTMLLGDFSLTFQREVPSLFSGT